MFNDLFIFDINTLSWILPSVSGEPPTKRAAHTATKIDEKYFCVFAGGDLMTVLNDTHLFNVENNTWIQIKPAGEIPNRRCGHTATMINGDSKILVFGGGDDDGKIYSDLYSLDLSYMVSNRKQYQPYLNCNSISDNIEMHASLEKKGVSRSSRRRAKKKFNLLNNTVVPQTSSEIMKLQT